jgi:hypothetical protein
VVKPKEREIIAWTKVLLGNDQFPPVISKTVLTYKTGQFLNEQVYPALPAQLRGGVILRLPLTCVRAEIEKLIDLSRLESDFALVKFLEEWLQWGRAQVETNSESITYEAFAETPLYKTWSDTLQ